MKRPPNPFKICNFGRPKSAILEGSRGVPEVWGWSWGLLGSPGESRRAPGELPGASRGAPGGLPGGSRGSRGAPKPAQEAPKTLQERLPDIDPGSGMAHGWGWLEPLGRRGLPGGG